MVGGGKLAVKKLLFSKGVMGRLVVVAPLEDKSAFLMDCLTPMERELAGCPGCGTFPLFCDVDHAMSVMCKSG